MVASEPGKSDNRKRDTMGIQTICGACGDVHDIGLVEQHYREKQAAERTAEAALPKAPPGINPAERPFGLYLHNDNTLGETLFAVVQSEFGQKFMFARQIITSCQLCGKDSIGHAEASEKCPFKATLARADGMVNMLTVSQRLSTIKARKYGTLYRFCMTCGENLEGEALTVGMTPDCLLLYRAASKVAKAA